MIWSEAAESAGPAWVNNARAAAAGRPAHRHSATCARGSASPFRPVEALWTHAGRVAEAGRVISKAKLTALRPAEPRRPDPGSAACQAPVRTGSLYSGSIDVRAYACQRRNVRLSALRMSSVLITTVAAVILAGCGSSAKTAVSTSLTPGTVPDPVARSNARNLHSARCPHTPLNPHAPHSTQRCCKSTLHTRT